MKILAIESSCDETAIAIIENGEKILSNTISSQIDIHKKFGGVVPEIASRHHMKNITQVLKMSLKDAKVELNEIEQIAVTYAPGLIGALLTGISFVKALAYSLDIPLISVHHMRAHIYANFIEHSIKLPAIALVVSGGHTNLVKLTEDFEFINMGGTVDDAVGECYDKVARIMGLGYPGGPIIDKLSKLGKNIIKMPTPKLKDKYNFSFSGIKTHVLNYINREKMKGNQINKENLAASFQAKIVDVLIKKTLLAVNQENIKTVLLAGGVAANSELRRRLGDQLEKQNAQLYFPSLKYCTDNGAMVGIAAYYKIIGEKQKIRNNFFELNAISTRDISLG